MMSIRNLFPRLKKILFIAIKFQTVSTKKEFKINY